MRKLALLLILCTIGGFTSSIYAQQLSEGQLHGDFLLDAQYYVEDEAIQAQTIPEKVGMNAYGNLNYTAGNFKAGVRFESYQPVLLGFDSRFQGSGITYRYAQYTNDNLDITIGNFYEQFGSGLTLRAYWEWYLGWDSNIDGLKVHYKPIPGVFLKGIIGKQRLYTNTSTPGIIMNTSAGIVRGFDAEFSINDIIGHLSSSEENAIANAKTRVIIGGSAVSRYQSENNDQLILPENVAAFAGRMNISRGLFNINAEYSYKINDPSAINQNSYNYGDALLITSSYSVGNFGTTISMKKWNNMDFRSDRSAIGFDALINYQPALTRQHTYRLSSLYSYPTVPLGEMAIQGDIFYNFKRGTALGGKYGTNVSVNVSAVNDIARDTTGMNAIRGEYSSGLFEIGDEMFYRDINVEVSKKLTKTVKILASVIRQNINYADQPAALSPSTRRVKTWIGIGELSLSYRVNGKRWTSRFELQHLTTEEDFGDWATLLFEQTITNHWYFTFLNEYNYGNAVASRRNNYASGAVGYRKDTYSIKLGGGRQRGGFLCVGGICRPVPENTGVTLTISSSF